MTAFKTNTDQFIKQRMMTYLKEQGYNFYQSATLLNWLKPKEKRWAAIGRNNLQSVTYRHGVVVWRGQWEIMLVEIPKAHLATKHFIAAFRTYS